MSAGRAAIASRSAASFSGGTSLNGPTREAPASEPLYQNVTTPIEFRYYPFGNEPSFLYLDNVQITGTATPVPEPAAAGFALAATAGAVLRRRRHGQPPPR